MKYRKLGNTDIDVSVICLGTMTWGEQNTPAQAFAQMDCAVSQGVNFFDTAELYAIPPRAETYGRTEEIIGDWLVARGNRDRVKIATKAAGDTMTVRKGEGFSGENLAAVLDGNLKRLKTDYIDLLFVHGIHGIKEMDADLESWSQAMKKAGKIRLFGFSTHSNMEDCLDGAAKLPSIDGIMFTYNYRLMHEPRMKDAVEACYRAGIGLTAMKTQGGGPVKSDRESEIEMAGRFIQKGFSDYQAKLMAVWEDERIASICSQMPNLTILATNAAAAASQPSCRTVPSSVCGRS